MQINLKTGNKNSILAKLLQTIFLKPRNFTKFLVSCHTVQGNSSLTIKDIFKNAAIKQVQHLCFKINFRNMSLLLEISNFLIRQMFTNNDGNFENIDHYRT